MNRITRALQALYLKIVSVEAEAVDDIVADFHFIVKRLDTAVLARASAAEKLTAEIGRLCNVKAMHQFEQEKAAEVAQKIRNLIGG